MTGLDRMFSSCKWILGVTRHHICHVVSIGLLRVGKVLNKVFGKTSLTLILALAVMNISKLDILRGDSLKLFIHRIV